MLQIALCMLLVGILLAAFWTWGMIPRVLLGVKYDTGLQQLLMGFFCYFLIFQCVAVPMVLLKQSVAALSIVWLVLFFVITVAAALPAYKEHRGICGFWREKVEWGTAIIVCAACLAVALAVLFSVVQEYNGWDCAFYIGTMNDALRTDHFYFFDGNTGEQMETLNLRYALSGYYVHFILWCRLLHIEARIMAFYVMRSLCVLLASAVVYLMGKRLFSDSPRKACCLLLLWLMIHLLWMEYHTTSYFLFARGYEAKGYCANVVLPMLLYGILGVFQERDIQNSWKQLALVAWASVPVSMSALVTVPAALAVFGLAYMIRSRSFWPVIGKCVLCVIPNLCYVLIYFLHVRGIIEIGV